MKKTLLLCLSLSFTLLTISGDKILKAESDELIIYQANFEDFTVDKNNTVDSQTGFIWANNWEHTKTEKHNNSNMLKCPLIDSNDYSVVGGFGIASNMNLSLCNEGETYRTMTYLEMQNIEKMYVEFVGGDEKWGSAIVYPNGNIECNPGGDNISNVSYSNNILTFNFTMAYNAIENCNGYIKFTAYNTKDGVVYFDDVKISYEECSYNNTFENQKLGQFNSTLATYLGNIYTDSSKTEIIQENGNKSLNVSYNAKSNQGVTAAYLNNLGFLNRNREYELSMDIKLTNVTKLYVYYGGTWVSPVNYVTIDLSSNHINVTGDLISGATLVNNKLTVKFVVSKTINNYKQFQFITESKDSGNVLINIDNIVFKQTPIISKLTINTTSAKTKFNYGEAYTKDGLIVIATYTNNNTRILNENEYEVMGFNSAVIGKQLLTITANGVKETYGILIVREAISITLDTSKVKTKYAYGEALDLTNLIVTAKYMDGDSNVLTQDIINGGYSIDIGGFDSYRSGEYVIKIICENVSASFKVEVLAKTSTIFDGINYEEM